MPNFSSASYSPSLNISYLNNASVYKEECLLLVQRLISCLSMEKLDREKVISSIENPETKIISLNEENMALSREILGLKEIIAKKEKEIGLLREELVNQEHCCNKVVNDNSKDGCKLVNNLHLENMALKNDNLLLQEKVMSLTEKISMLKSILQKQDRQLEDYDDLIVVLKDQRKTIIEEIRQLKSTSEEYRRNLGSSEEQIDLMEVVTTKKIFLECSNPELTDIDEDSGDSEGSKAVENEVHELVKCYEKRLYEAFHELKKKGEKLIHVEALNSSLDEMIETLKKEKMEIMTDLNEQRELIVVENKKLAEEKIKLEETVKQQAKLIDHQQDLLKKRDKKSPLSIFCSFPEKEHRNQNKPK